MNFPSLCSSEAFCGTCLVSLVVVGTLCEALASAQSRLGLPSMQPLLPAASPGFLAKACVTRDTLFLSLIHYKTCLSSSPRAAPAYAINTQFVSGNGPSSCFECLLFLAKLSIRKMGSPEEGPAFLFTLAWVLYWQPLTAP